MIKTFSATALLLFVVSIIESMLLSSFTFLPAIPDISLLCVLYLSLHNGRIFGETSGFVSGLFLDFLSAAPFGFNCLLRTITGYIGGLFTKSINTEGTIIPCLLGFLATILKIIVTGLISILYPASVATYDIFSWNILFELLLNTALCPVVFKFISVFKKTLILNPENVR